MRSFLFKFSGLTASLVDDFFYSFLRYCTLGFKVSFRPLSFILHPCLLTLGLLFWAFGFSPVLAANLPVPYPAVTAPVVHSGKFHILSCQNTVVVLDGSNGMSIYMIGQSTGMEKKLDSSGAVLMYAGLHATIQSGGHAIELDQAFEQRRPPPDHRSGTGPGGREGLFQHDVPGRHTPWQRYP